MRKQKILDLLITFVVWYIVSLSIHEFWHYETATWLGGKGITVTYPSFFTGSCHFPVPFPHMWVAYLAGGLGTAIIMFLLAWRALLSPTKWDEDEVFSLFVLGGAQLGYGIAELSLYFIPGWFSILAGLGAFVGAFPMAIWRGPKLIDFILDNSRVQI